HIRHQPVFGPVPATDDITRSNRGNHGALGFGTEEATDVGARYQLGAAFAAGVGILSSHRIYFTIAPSPLSVLVAFVASHIDDEARARAAPRGLEQMDRPHHIGFIGAERIIIGSAHEGLSGHVDDNIWLERLNLPTQAIAIPDISDNAIHSSSDIGHLEQVRLRRWVQRVAEDLCAEGL